MNKQQFLTAIKGKLSDLPQDDIDKSLDYYQEMIDDRIEDGMTEEQAVEGMGSVDEIVSQILLDTPLPKLMKAKIFPSRALHVWEIVLLVLGSPVWVPLLLAAVIIILSVYIIIWSAIIALYAADISFAAGGLAGIVGSISLGLTHNSVQALFFLGAGLICAGLSVLLFFTFNKLTLGIIALSKRFIQLIKSWFIPKGDVI